MTPNNNSPIQPEFYAFQHNTSMPTATSIRKIFLLAGLITGLFPIAGVPVSAAAEKPNVIIILTDDQGMGDFSLYGNPVVQTPHLDSLAQSGVSFDQFHVTSMCSPTRAALLTGKNPLRNGTISTCQGLHGLRPEHSTVAEVFAENGYATGLFGKWHLGRNWPSRPQDVGFEETLTLWGFGPTGISSRWNNDYIDTWVTHNGTDRQLDGFCTDALFDETMQWVETKVADEEPFFTYLSLNAPHFPFWAPEEWTEPYADSLNPEFFAMVKNIDDNIGRLQAFLEQQGIRDDTILLYTTDNGPVGGHATWNAGMRGTKASPWEAGHRVPLFIQYPNGRFRDGEVIEGLTSVVDIFPTLMDLAGIQKDTTLDLDGISLSAAMRAEETVPDRTLFMHIQQFELSPKMAAVMQGPWRLLWSDTLYNLDEDLAQQKNVATEHPEKFVELWRAYQAFYHAHREYATTAQAEVIGSPHQDEVVLDASYWIGIRTDGQPQVRKVAGKHFDPEGGPWKVDVAQPGTYAITLRRWPVESGLALDAGTPPFQTLCSGKPLPAGKALPITQATLDVGSLRYTSEPCCDPSAIRFEIALPAGETMLHGIFRDDQGKALCGAFYAYIKRI